MSRVLSVTGRAGCTVLLRMECNLKLVNCLFLELFHLIFSGRGKPQITEAADTESADTGVLLYLFLMTARLDKRARITSLSIVTRLLAGQLHIQGGISG